MTKSLPNQSQQLILCPLKIELKWILETLSQQGFASNSLVLKGRPLIFFPQLNKIFAVGGLGKAKFFASTQFYLQTYRQISSVICAGSGGALSEIVKLLDVVASTQTIEHDRRDKIQESLDLPRFPGNEILLKKIMDIKPTNFKIHSGAIASGDENILSADRANELYRKTAALAVGWEGVGGAKICQEKNMPFLEIRAITDLARQINEENVESQFKKNLPKAMANLAEVLLSF